MRPTLPIQFAKMANSGAATREDGFHTQRAIGRKQNLKSVMVIISDPQNWGSLFLLSFWGVFVFCLENLNEMEVEYNHLSAP